MVDGAEIGGEQPPRRIITPQRAVALVYVVAMFMNVMDTQIVNVAIPSLIRDFHTTTGSVQWVITAYVMAIAVAVPASGWIGDRFGTKKIMMIAVGSFTAASALCARSTSLDELIATRILQGIGGGMMVPVGMTMLYRAYPQSQRVRVARMLTAVMVLAPASAPLIGGAFVTYVSWRFIFLVNLPFGCAALLFGFAFLIEHAEPRKSGFDVVGFVSGALGLALLLYSVGSGPTSGWASFQVISTGGVALGSLALFVRTELSREHPMLNIRLLAVGSFRRSASLIVFQSTAFLGTITFTGLYLQAGRGFSAIDAGLSTFPEAIAIGFSAQIVSRLFPRIGPRRLVTAGFIVLSAVIGLLSTSGADTSLWVIRAYCFGIGIGVSYIMLPNQVTAFAAISPADTGHASALYNTLQRALASLSIAGLSTVLSLAGGEVAGKRPPISAFRTVFEVCAAMAAVGAIFALRIRDSDAGSVMVRRSKLPKDGPVELVSVASEG